MEEMAPAVMWFDEIEMGVIGAQATDAAGGAQDRIFAFFLTWMQEKTRGLFVAATANRIDLLPAEMIRKGRFDEVFFVDLPNEEERLDICRIHLEKRGIDPAALGLDRLKQFTRGWTGAEIEQLVVSALTTAKLENRELTGDDLLNQTAKIVPLSKTMKEQVEHIRSWALDRAVRTAPRSSGAVGGAASAPARHATLRHALAPRPTAHRAGEVARQGGRLADDMQSGAERHRALAVGGIIVLRDHHDRRRASCSPRSAARNSKPSSSGMMRSSSTRSQRPPRSAASPSRPSAAPWTSKPARLNRKPEDAAHVLVVVHDQHPFTHRSPAAHLRALDPETSNSRAVPHATAQGRARHSRRCPSPGDGRSISVGRFPSPKLTICRRRQRLEPPSAPPLRVTAHTRGRTGIS